MAEPWKMPPLLKILEALGAVADGRVRETGEGAAAVASSDGRKTYTVTWDAATRTLSCNDNASYWQSYVGYPALAYLMVQGALPCAAGVAATLAGLEWKALNDRLRDHDKVLAHLERERGLDLAAARAQARAVLDALAALAPVKPARRTRPA